jgi:hypothetical protein
MRITNYIMTFTMYPLLLLATTCVKDSEENNDVGDDSMEVIYTNSDKVTKEMAVENWEMFIKESQKLIEITEVNIHSIETKIENANESEKPELLKIYNESIYKLTELKDSRMQRNKEFSVEILNYKMSIQQKNEKFKKDFKKDMLSLNTSLETCIEKDQN